MGFGPSIRYPAGPITPHGAYMLMHDRTPHVVLRSYDDSIVFNLAGPLAIPDRTIPERVELKKILGLSPDWKNIDQKGASQDGVTYVDSLYDPIELELEVDIVGRDTRHMRQVFSHLISAVDAKKESELSFFTHEFGRWWAPVRWSKSDSSTGYNIATGRRQPYVLKMRSDQAFWQTYPNVDQFRFGYDDVVDDFDYLTAEGDPIAGWNLQYAGGGSGSLYTDGDQAVSTFTGTRSVIAEKSGYSCSADNVVVSVQIGTNSQPSYPANTYVDIWARMNNSGTIGSDGIRCRLGPSTIRLSSFDSGVETVIREQWYGGYWWWFWFIGSPPPQPGETFTLVCGTEEDKRTFKVLRNNAEVFTAKESGTTSKLGPGNRKVGFGEATAAGSIRPCGVRRFTAGVNATNAQEGRLIRVNIGDQPMWDRYNLFGPGIFYIGNGPASTDYVKVGPLLPGQVMQVRTDPRKRGIVDMSARPVSTQTYAEWAKALYDYQSFLSVGGTPPANSVFGVLTPQGNPYTLMKGRFSRPIPARSPGEPLKPYYVNCKIDNGNQDSQILAVGTPLRRMPF